MDTLLLRRCVLLLSSAFFVSTSTALAQDEAIAEAVVEPATKVQEELATATPERKLRPLTVTVGLSDDTRLTGTLIESTDIGIKTAFGEASIPLSEVAGIRFPAADDSSTTIVMLNGDSITGATDMKFLGIETAWGSAKVNGQSISTLLFVPGLQWTSNVALGGKRWSLVEDNAMSSLSPPLPSGSLGIVPVPAQSIPSTTRRFDSNGQLPPPRVIFGQ